MGRSTGLRLRVERGQEEGREEGRKPGGGDDDDDDDDDDVGVQRGVRRGGSGRRGRCARSAGRLFNSNLILPTSADDFRVDSSGPSGSVGRGPEPPIPPSRVSLSLGPREVRNLLLRYDKSPVFLSFFVSHWAFFFSFFLSALSVLLPAPSFFLSAGPSIPLPSFVGCFLLALFGVLLLSVDGPAAAAPSRMRSCSLPSVEDRKGSVLSLAL